MITIPLWVTHVAILFAFLTILVAVRDARSKRVTAREYVSMNRDIGPNMYLPEKKQ